MLCRYQNILGKIGEGIHSKRIYNIAIYDVIFTVIGAYIIHLFIPNSKFWIVLSVLFIIGIILHRLFCVKTTVDVLLFG